jgi:chromosome segregation ATPase
MKYELETIKTTMKKYKDSTKKAEDEIKTNKEALKSAQAKLEALKTTAVTMKMKQQTEQEEKKMELEITGQVSMITELEGKITRQETNIVEWKAKIASLREKRKQIKYTVEIKVLEAKEAEAAVLEAIKTVTDVELLNRKRWIASKTVGNYKKCNKYMVEFKQIYDKQSQTITTELNDHTRRIDVAEGAIASLKEKKKLLEDAKSTKDLEIQMDKIESEIKRHTKVTEVEEKVVTAVKEKQEKNEKEYKEQIEKCDKAKAKANIAGAAVNDAATTLKNQREYQVQVTNLKNTLIGSHEEAITKRQEAEKIFQNYTMMISKYEQQMTVTTEQITDAKTKISGAEEIKRIMSVREKEIATLLSRTTITAGEKEKLTAEEGQIKVKLETQSNVVDTETKNLVNYETTFATLTKTTDKFKMYIKEIKEVIHSLEVKVFETKSALKATKKDEKAPPVKGKDSEEADAEEKDEDGDDKIDDVDEKEEEASAVKGGNEKVDKELD